jgi:type I restriction enzyme, S subunit
VSSVDKLIAEMCPDGVPFKALSEIADCRTGDQLNKTAMDPAGQYPVLNGGIAPSGRCHKFNANANTIAISQGGASAGFVSFMGERFWAGAHCFILTLRGDSVSTRYLFHVLKNGQYILQAGKQGAGIPGLSRSSLQAFQVPVPPPPVQSEIVRILDKFTQLEAELEAELEARRKQYEHYRERLLTFKELEG